MAGIGQSDCERIMDAALAQPVLTLTSIAYIAAGLTVAVCAGRAGAPLSAAVGAALVAVGAGSLAYHGPQPSWAAPAHDWPIVALGVMCVVGLVRSGIRREWSRWAVPAAIFALGLVVYVAGRSGSPLCRPESLWQFHGAWHVLSAAAAATAAWAMAPGRSGARDTARRGRA